MKFNLDICKRAISFCLLAVALLTASLPTAQANGSDAGQPDPRTTKKFQYYFLEALRQRSLKQYDAAADNLLRCLCLDPNKAAVYSELANLNISCGKNKLAKNYMLKAVSLDPTNIWTNQVLAQLYTDNNEYELAATTFEQILKKDPDNADYYYYMLAQLYTKNQQYDKAIKAWDGLEETNGISDRITMEKFKLYVAQDKVNKAFDEIDKLIKAFPMDAKYKVLKGDLYQAVGKNEKAESAYKKVLKSDPNNSVAKTQLAMLYISNKRENEGMNMIKSVLGDSLADIDIKKNILAYVSQDSIVMTRIDDSIFLNLIKMHPNEEFPYLAYSSFLLDKKNLDGFKYMRKALEINPKYEDSWNLLINYYMMENDTIGIYNACTEALEHFPENANFYYTLGIVYQNMDKKDSTIYAWNKAVNLLKGQNLTLASVIQGSVGDVYSSLGKKEAAYAAYDSAIVLDEKNMLVLNNYAYFLACDGKELQKAERMSAMTVQAHPKNATFLDTYAWVFFKQGNYLLAMMYIEQALANGGGDNAELLEHYGDILFMNENKDKANDFWKRAYDLHQTGDPSKYEGLDKLKQKIESGTYVE